MTRPVIVITGAAGNIGGKLRRSLEDKPCDLRLIDIASSDPAIVHADLSKRSPGWTSSFTGADVIVHAAANPSSAAAWPDLVGPNIDATLNVYAEAKAAGVRRVVLMSSVWAMAGRREETGLLRADDADPGGNAYGATKVVGERTARMYHDRHGIDGVAIRLGGCLPGDNAANLSAPGWERDCWISNPDMLDGLHRAIFGGYAGFHVVNLVSRNPGMRWSLSEAFDVLGYDPAPQPGPAPQQTDARPASPLHRARRRVGRWVRGLA